MWAYLPKPVTAKVPKDEANDFLEYGASSMQGWRLSQEDDHNCLLDYDKDTSFFAVYDGHGGADVAKYTAECYPGFLKNLKEYEEENIKDALISSFLGFDASLREDSAKEKLRELAELNFDDDCDDEERAQETAMLFEEADMPLDQLLMRYDRGGAGDKPLLAIHRAMNKDKILSPMITSKKDGGVKKEDLSGEDLMPDPKGQLFNGHDKPDIVDSTNNEAKAAIQSNGIKAKTEVSSMGDAEISSGKDTASVESKPKPEIAESSVTKSDNGATESNEAVVSSCSSGEGGSSANAKATSSADDDDAVGSSSMPMVTSSDGGGSSNATAEANVGSSSSADQGDEPCSSSGKTRKKRRGVIPEEGEDESSFDEDEETTDEEEDSDDELAGEKPWSDSDSEDDSEEDDDCGPFGDGEDDETEIIPFGEEPGFDTGCTAVVALLRKKTLYVANAGDSRCVLCRGGKAVDLSVDHKPEDPIEKSRINKAGGRITADGRVNGGLNLSRAIGDHRFKQSEKVSFREQMITSEPDVVTTELGDKDEFVVLACDGIWNVMSSQDVVDFVRERIMSGAYLLSDICGEMFELCLAPDTMNDGTGCDNMTCIIINLNPKKRSSEADAKPVAEKSPLRKELPAEGDDAVDSTGSDDALSGKRKADAETESDASSSTNKRPKVDSSQGSSADSTG